MEFAVWLER